MFLSYQYRLYPLHEQLATFDHHLYELTFLWNFALAQRCEAWERRQEQVSCVDQQNLLKKWRAFDSEGLGRLSFGVARDCLQRLDLAFGAFFRRLQAQERTGFPKFRRETRSFTFIPESNPLRPGPRRTWRLHVPRVGEVPVRLHRPLPDGAVVKSATVRFDAGAWFVTLVVALPDPLPPPQSPPERPVGIDLGVARLATLSTGELVPRPAVPARLDRRLRLLQKGLSRKRRGSHRYARQRERVARLHARIRRKRRWRAHQLSLGWSQQFDLVAFEDLDAARLIEGNRLARSLSDAAWGELRQLTAYKMAMRSKRCIWVPSEGTSQECSGCGRRADPPLGLGDRSFSCPCGVTLDRDQNAARNILGRGLTLLKTELRRSPPEVKREEGGPPPRRVGRRVYQRRRVAPRNREDRKLASNWPRTSGDGKTVRPPRRPET